MQSEPTLPNTEPSAAGADAITVCPNCRTQMPRELRFCRACGFRLGEGVAEFTETVRFQNPPPRAAQAFRTSDARGAATAAPPASNPFGNLNELGALARDLGEKAIKNATKHLDRQQRKEQQRKERRHRSHWKSWLILIILISVVSSNGFWNRSALRGLRIKLGDWSGSSAGASRSWVGTSDFETTTNGVTFDQVEPAGSPADKAGLVGGDVVTTFDGQPVKSADEFHKLLKAIPVGKTVDVIYLRDGETRTTKLTTVSEDEIDRLEAVASSRTDGFVGIGTDRDRVQVPGTNSYGVRLNSIRQNNPADIAGIKDGDIIVEFDGVPIRTDEELESRTRRAVPGSTVKVVVVRGSERLEIPVKVGVD